MKKNIYKFISLVVVLLALSSCGEKDVRDENIFESKSEISESSSEIDYDIESEENDLTTKVMIDSFLNETGIYDVLNAKIKTNATTLKMLDKEHFEGYLEIANVENDNKIVEDISLEACYLKNSPSTHFKMAWGGISDIDDTKISFTNMKEVKIYNAETLEKENIEFKDLDKHRGKGKICGVTHDKDFGYAILINSTKNRKILMYDDNGQFISEETLEDKNSEKIFMEEKDIVGKPGDEYQQYFSFTTNYSDESSKKNALRITETEVYLPNLQKTIVHNRMPILNINIPEEKKIISINYWHEEKDSLEKTYVATIYDDINAIMPKYAKHYSKKPYDSFIFKGITIPNHMKMNEMSGRVDKLENNSYKKYFSIDERDIEGLTEDDRKSHLESLNDENSSGTIELDFNKKQGKIVYNIKNDTIDKYSGKRKTSEDGKYSIVEVNRSGAGDGFWYDVALLDNTTGKFQYIMPSNYEFIYSEIEFVGNTQILIKSLSSIYNISDLSFVKKLDLEIPKKEENKFIIDMYYDNAKSRIITVTAYETLADSMGWVGLYDTPLSFGVYDGEGKFIRTLETDILSRSQSMYSISPPNMKMENDDLFIGYDSTPEKQDNPWDFKINVVIGEVKIINEENVETVEDARIRQKKMDERENSENSNYAD